MSKLTVKRPPKPTQDAGTKRHALPHTGNGGHWEGLFSWAHLGMVVLWLVCWWGWSYWGFGAVYVILSMMYGMFSNLGTRKAGEMSAYSV